MPKRRSPPLDDNPKDEVKKARTSPDARNSGEDGAGIAVKLSAAANAGVERVSTAASRMYSAAAGAVLGTASENPPTKKPSQASPTPPTSTKSGGKSKSGSNAFLKSVRCNENGGKSTVGNGKTSAVPKEEPTDEKTIDGIPIVPFPHLPVQKESKLHWQSIVIFFLVLLNMSSALYISFQQTWHNTVQMKHNLELNKLQDELASSQGEVDILRQRMNELEKLREAGENLLSDTASGHLLTNEEVGQLLEKLRLLEKDRHVALDDFNKKLEEFGE